MSLGALLHRRIYNLIQILLEGQIGSDTSEKYCRWHLQCPKSQSRKQRLPQPPTPRHPTPPPANPHIPFTCLEVAGSSSCPAMSLCQAGRALLKCHIAAPADKWAYRESRSRARLDNVIQPERPGARLGSPCWVFLRSPWNVMSPLVKEAWVRASAASEMLYRKKENKHVNLPAKTWWTHSCKVWEWSLKNRFRI